MKFYDTRNPLYLQSDVSGFGLSTGLLQIRHGVNCTHDNTTNDTILCALAFTSKSLSGAEW